ncbi:hypothetical protein RFI_25312 [Reticulomyxa filosa]|uniref:Uncharacterized protein n=1 Tax=Reticulomyxa filosa TaxID=46433 RepID=X6MG84_RETFI|nr:hypothetical protein RFI_25312 [Reticulomyxa filosa]|eukprot:ETO12065.1 hypothetical protein RFI_25312 [Reticulomyxa filosa]
MKKLNELQTTELHFEEKKCKNCSLIGDPRFSDDVSCHLLATKVHKNGVEPKQVHFGTKKAIHASNYDLEWYHPDDSLVHPGNKEKFHDKSTRTETQHSKEMYLEHETTQTRQTVVDVKRRHRGTKLNTVLDPYLFFFLVAPVSNILRVMMLRIDVAIVEKLFHTTCGSNSGVNMCTYCNQRIDSEGCDFEMVHVDVHICCGKSKGSIGCLRKCSSCRQTLDKRGCTSQTWHVCCEGDEKSEGCCYRWNCCQTNITSTTKGCKLKCCSGEPGSKGCKQRYSCCKQPLGSEKACKEEWTCCSQIDPTPGCKLQWPCCQAIVSLYSPNDEKSACQQVCKICGGIWGKSDGCTNAAKHEFEEKIDS